MLGQRPGSVQPGYGQADKTFCLSIAHNTLIIYIVLTSMQHNVVTRKSPQSNKEHGNLHLHATMAATTAS